MSYDYADHQGPTTVAYTVVAPLYDYIIRAINLGAIVGPIGDHRLNDPLRQIVNAAHHVLAGGEVEVKVNRSGNPDIVNELGRRFEQVGKDANEINKHAGYYVAGWI